MRLESYLKKCNVRIMKCLHIFLSSLKQIQDKTALHLQCCQVCWHMLASRLEGNKHVFHIHRSTACLLATICSNGSLQNITLSEVFKAFTTKRRQRRKHCTRNDVLSILAILFFGGKGDYAFMLSYAISL